MSEWFEVKDPDDVDLSDDGKSVHILFSKSHAGNRYIEVPVEILAKLLAAQQGVQSDGALPSYNCECGFIVAIGETECMRCHTPRR